MFTTIATRDDLVQYLILCFSSTKNISDMSDFIIIVTHLLLYQIRSVAQSCPTLCDPMNCSTPGLPVHHQLPEFTQTHFHQVGEPSSHLILSRPLLLLPPIPPSIRVFSNESTLRIRWPKTGVSALASFLPKKSQG